MTTIDSGARAITNAAEHKIALRRIEAIWDSEDPQEKSELDALATLVDHYERKTVTFDALDPIEALAHAMSEDVGHSRADLNALIGPTRASEILHRKRPLTLEMVRSINAAWGIPLEVLIQPYALAQSKPQSRDAVGLRPLIRKKNQRYMVDATAPVKMQMDAQGRIKVTNPNAKPVRKRSAQAG